MFGFCIAPKDHVNAYIHNINTVRQALKQDNNGGDFYIRQAMSGVRDNYPSAAAQVQHLTIAEQELVKPILALDFSEIETGIYEFPLLQ